MEVVASPPQILMLPINDLAVPDWNPRKVVFEEPLKNLIAYIQAGGRLPRILVWKGNGQAPWAIISGQRRREAFKRLGYTQVEVEVMDIPLEQAEFLAMGSNEGEPVFWLDWDIRAEKLYQEGNKDGRKLTQADLAAQLGVSQPKINSALKVAGVLTPASREAIYHAVIKSGDPDRVKERPILALAALGDSAGVEKALPQVIDGQMIEGQVRHMVADLKTGSTPNPLSQKDPVPARQAIAEVEGQSPKTTRLSSVAQGKSGGLSGLLSGLFHPKTLVSAGLAGAVGAFLLQNLRRALGTLARRWMIHAMVGLGIVALLSPHLFVSVFHLFHSNTSAARPAPQIIVAPEPNTGSEAAPVKPAPQTKATKPKAKAPAAKARVTQLQAISPQMEAWAASDAPLAREFANRFYGISYMNWDGTMDYFRAHMVEDEAPVFIQQYFPPTLLRQFQEKRLVLFFEDSKPPQLVKVEGTKDEFLAQGNVTTESYLTRNPQTLSKKPVALLVEIWHEQGFGTRVGKAAEVTPEEVKAFIQNAPSLPVGKPKDLGQKDKTDQAGNIIGNAANAAATAAAGEAVRKLLPFKPSNVSYFN